MRKILLDIIIANQSQNYAFFNIPVATILQILLSITIPLLIFWLGAQAGIKKDKIKELNRLSVLKNYYILRIRSVIKLAKKQNSNYSTYALNLAKLDYMQGVEYHHVETSIDKLNAIDDKDVYKIFMELNDNLSDENAANLVALTTKLAFIQGAAKSMESTHKGLISYITELRDKWNKQMTVLHNLKHTLVVEWFGDDEIVKEYSHLMNLEFNAWYKKKDNGLKASFIFIKEVEAITKRYYARHPSSSIVSEMLGAIQDLRITYQMFTHYRLAIFKQVKYYHRSLNKTLDEVEGLVRYLEDSKMCEWKKIKSY